MKIRFIEEQKLLLKDTYNTRDEYAKGRLVSLGSSLMTAFYNVFITGIFYTGFLSMYGISITGVGIISYIPMLSSCLCVFSPAILERIRRRKPVLLAMKIYFYAMYILASTWMPLIVTDPDKRVLWFGIIIFLAHAVYALFSPGITTWFYAFYPANQEERSRYITYNQLFTSIGQSLLMIFSSILTDAVSGSPFQNQLILGMRYLAFVLVIIDVVMQMFAKEFEQPVGRRAKLHELFTLPFKYKRFTYCLILMFFWSYVSNLNNGLWQYHLLNHLDFSYTLINFASVLYTIIFLLCSQYWRKIIRYYSWIKSFGLACLLFMPSEIILFMLTKENQWLFIPTCIFQNLMAVGLNLTYSNILYINLPEENSTVHVSFHAMGCNICAFLGLLTGTAISGITGDDPVPLFGMNFYSVQYTLLARAVLICAVGLICFYGWRWFTKPEDVEMIEEINRPLPNSTRLGRLMRFFQ